METLITKSALSLFHKYGERGLTVDLVESRRWAKIAAEKEGALGLAVLASIELEAGKVEKGDFSMTRLIFIPICVHLEKLRMHWLYTVLV